MMNHVPFEVILDDDIAAGRLADYDALVIPRGDTLRRSDHAKIAAFAQTKTVIVDESLRASIPNAKKVNLDFSFQSALVGTRLAAGTGITADEFRTKNEALSAQLKPLVAPFATAKASSPRVLLSTLESGSVRYVFAVNDDKTYGPRFGPWKLMHELGVRQNAKITLPNPNTIVYDALARTAIETPNGEFETLLPAARGRLFVVLPERIGKIEITAPKSVTRGAKLPFSVRVLGASGQPLGGTVPLQIEVFDAAGDKHPASRMDATSPNGAVWDLRQTLSLALNDEGGTWTLRATELLGGAKIEAKFVVN